MGLDLKLLPVDADIPEIGVAFAHTVLDCERRGELFDAIQTLPADPAPADLRSYVSRDGDADAHYGITNEDPYGRPLRAVAAEVLCRVASHPGVTDNWKNRAIWAYLAQLPPAMRVVLYWD